MKALLAALLTAGTLAVHPAAAQTGSTSETTTSETAIAPQQRTAIREFIARERATSLAAPSGLRLTVGVALPDTMVLHSFPSSFGVPYRYVVIENRTVLVDPGTRRIVQIVE